MNLEVVAQDSPTISEGPFEGVGRKGRGHPDTICDLLVENAATNLSQFYLRHCGRALHFNLDKALLVRGSSAPRFGGGKIIEFPKFYLGDRAVSPLNGRRFDLDAVIEESITRSLQENLRFLRLHDNLVWKSEIKEGAAALNSVDDRHLSNDTSVGVGFWPLSRLEHMTLAVEEYMNSTDFKQRHPASGEDIKVMCIRSGSAVETVIACAFVDHYIANVDDYQIKKGAVLDDVKRFLNIGYANDFQLSVTLNALDDLTRGTDGLYLTVTGLSCEGGDSGEVGRGNRVNGLISFLRPQTTEAWAGKNFSSHVGKIYSFAAPRLAREVTEALPEVKEATVLLVGKIGSRVDQPPHVYTNIKFSGHYHGAAKAKVSIVLSTAIAKGAIFLPEGQWLSPSTTADARR